MTRADEALRTVEGLRRRQAPAAELLREIERIAHDLGTPGPPAAHEPSNLRALYDSIQGLKAQIAARVATLTVLRDAIRAADSAPARSMSGYDNHGMRRRL